MPIIADTHVHLYDCYNFDEFFSNVFSNLEKHGSNAVKALFLAERSGCNVFVQLKEKGLKGKYSVEDIGDEGGIKINAENGFGLYLFAGRQVVTKERLEILSLLSDTLIEDGMPAKNVIKAAKDAGGVPVITWAMGKWMFERGRIVKSLIEQAKPGELLVGDSYMRPVSFAEPSQMQMARESGLTILAGTDPLPHHGEEKVVGRYASLIQADLDNADPVNSLRKILTSEKPSVMQVGARSGLLGTVKRWMQ